MVELLGEKLQILYRRLNPSQSEITTAANVGCQIGFLRGVDGGSPTKDNYIEDSLEQRLSVTRA